MFDLISYWVTIYGAFVLQSEVPIERETIETQSQP